MLVLHTSLHYDSIDIAALSDDILHCLGRCVWRQVTDKHLQHDKHHCLLPVDVWTMTEPLGRGFSVHEVRQRRWSPGIASETTPDGWEHTLKHEGLSSASSSYPCAIFRAMQ